MSAPEPRPAAGFPWLTHRTLWDVAHGHTPEAALFVPVSSYAGQAMTESKIGRIDGVARPPAAPEMTRK